MTREQTEREEGATNRSLMEEEGSQLAGRGEETLRREEGSYLDQGGEIRDERELTLPPSSLGVEEVGGRVVTPTEFPQFRGVGAMTQRRIFEYLTPVRCEEMPHAEVFASLPTLRRKEERKNHYHIPQRGYCQVDRSRRRR